MIVIKEIINQMRFFILLSNIVVCVPQQLFSQKSFTLKSEFLLNLELTPITNTNSIKQIKTGIDSFRKNNVQPYGKNESFNFSNNWKLTYCMQTGYHENFPGAYTDTIGFSKLEPNGTTSCQFPKNKETSISGFELFKIFGLSKVKFPINYFPGIYARDSRFNGEWTAISQNDEYLIIRYVSSYPDGNQTSWYREETYYFRQDERNKYLNTL